jgi:glycerate kinase
LAAGFGQAGAVADEVPLADGGEGTADALQGALGGEWRSVSVSDPLGRPVDARFVLLPDRRAVVEAAEAIGVWRLSPAELDPLHASSRGLGELMRGAVHAGAERILVALGGTATVDGGAGLREVLDELPVPVDAACDVRNPLLGERGAARAFAPQKGASARDVEELERRLAGREELAPYAELPGAGAAGGLGAALAALGARLVGGADLVLEAVRFREHIRNADLVVTGEGVVDASSSEGKVTGAVVVCCRAEGIRCAVFGGRVEVQLEGAAMHELSGDPACAREDLSALGERLGGSLDC